ncbi:hypothetical protein HG530_011095 [Fusarium avenaceum]|nr:hypothetical protein HG530_011095 [Fusarium avenaceum]
MPITSFHHLQLGVSLRSLFALLPILHRSSKCLPRRSLSRQKWPIEDRVERHMAVRMVGCKLNSAVPAQCSLGDLDALAKHIPTESATSISRFCRPSTNERCVVAFVEAKNYSSDNLFSETRSDYAVFHIVALEPVQPVRLLSDADI